MSANLFEKSHKKRLVLLDANAIIHRAYHALPDFSNSKGEPTGALYGISTMLMKIIEDIKPDYIVACYDLAGPTHRHEIYKDYKAGRAKTDDALIAQLQSSRKVFESMGIPIYDKEGFEADDILGTIVEKMKDNDGVETVIASGDMDTLQLVRGKDVRVFTLKKGINDTVFYDEDAVIKRFGFGPELIPDYKGLRGDPSDNIIGVKGIGEKTASILISSFGSVEKIYKALESKKEADFAKVGIKPRIMELLKENKEEAEFSKMLATINRKAPIDFSLPAKTFKDNIDMEKIKALWSELEFRTLGPRMEKALGVAGEVKEEAKKSSLSENELEKLKLATWVLNSNITNPDTEDILNYAKTDDLDKAQKIIFAELEKKDEKKVYEKIEMPLVPVVHAMHERGIKIDRELIVKMSKEYHASLEILQEKIWKLAGEEFNISSPKQLGNILFDKLALKAKNMKKTEGGARSTKESELEKLRDLHPIVPLIFEYRELSKLLSTYIDAIPPLLDKEDRLHSTFILSGSTTGRMASENPNLQNIPIKSELGKAIRKAFIAEKGFVLASFDYSQMELRIGAFMSDDKKLTNIFKNKEDVHTSVASYMFKVPAKDVTSEMRRQAKVINFGIIYGMGVLALKQNLGSSREEAQNFYNEYFKNFSELATYLEKIKAETARKGYTETFFGRKRYFEGINSKIPFIRAAAERMAINAPIQGTGADLVKIAMAKIFDFIKEQGLGNEVYPLLQVHDELIFEISKDKIDEVAPKIKKIMESIIDPKETGGVVMEASYNQGKNWGDLK